jgi:hypothetical protein
MCRDSEVLGFVCDAAGWAWGPWSALGPDLESIVVRDLPQSYTEEKGRLKSSRGATVFNRLEETNQVFWTTDDWRTNRSVPDGPHALFLCETLWPSVVNL